jgi:hypothetical protein
MVGVRTFSSRTSSSQTRSEPDEEVHFSGRQAPSKNIWADLVAPNLQALIEEDYLYGSLLCYHQSMNPVYIGKGDLAGRGVYASRDIKQGEVVISYRLIPLSCDEFDDLPKSERMFTHVHRGQIFLYGEPERFVNHDDNPNTIQDLERQCDVAKVDIRKGQMITTDSNMDDVQA